MYERIHTYAERIICIHIDLGVERRTMCCIVKRECCAVLCLLQSPCHRAYRVRSNPPSFFRVPVQQYVGTLSLSFSNSLKAFATSDPCADVATGFRYPWSRDSGTCLGALFLEDVHVARVGAACEVKEQSDEVPHCICMCAFLGSL